MSGAHCERFPSCLEISNQPRAPKCAKADCPGKPTWPDFMKLEGNALDTRLRQLDMNPDDLLAEAEAVFGPPSTETAEKAKPLPDQVSAEMARIKRLFVPVSGADKEDLITYAREIVRLRAGQ